MKGIIFRSKRTYEQEQPLFVAALAHIFESLGFIGMKLGHFECSLNITFN